MKRTLSYFKSLALLLMLAFGSQQVAAQCLPITDTIRVSVCTGGKGYYVNSLSAYVSTPGTYYDTLFRICGVKVDSVNVIIISSGGTAPGFTVNASLCAAGGGPGGNTYTYRDSLFTIRGGGGGGVSTFHYFAHSTVGCDTDITVNVTVIRNARLTRDSVSASICAGSTYSFYGMTLTTAGVYKDTLRYISGCDSVIHTIKLSTGAYAPPLYTTSICTGDTVTYHGKTYTTTGNYTDTIFGAGCDTIYSIRINKSLIQRADTVIGNITCAGGSFTYGSQTYTFQRGGGGPGGGANANLHRDTIINPAGCDSVVIVRIVRGSAALTFTDSVCPGASYTYRGKTYTPRAGGGFGGAVNTFYDTIAVGSGCDTIWTIYLPYKAGTAQTVIDSGCANSVYHFRDSMWTITAGGGGGGGFRNTHFYTALGKNGACDTIYTIRLNPITPPTVTLTGTGCVGTVYHYRDSAWTIRPAGGGGGGGPQVVTYYAHSAVGCDTAIVISITRSPAPTMTVNVNGCIGQMYHYRDSAWMVNTPGGGGGGGRQNHIYYAHNAGGCDSIITIRITPGGPGTIPNIRRVTGSNVLITDSPSTAYVWLKNGVIVPGATAPTLVATMTGNYQVVVTGRGGCTDTSAIFNIVIQGLDEVSNKLAFAVYPNPNTGVFTIEGANIAGNEAVVYDLLGRVVYQKAITADKETIATSNLVSGSYMIVVRGRETSRPVHFVLSK
jgi:Secretion system C-terminal sorting domain